MGVDMRFMTIFGVKLDGYDKNFSNAYHDYGYDEHGEFTPFNEEDLPYVCFDGMCGQYMFFGILLYNSGSDRMGFNGDTMNEIDISMLRLQEIEYRNKFISTFPDFSHLIKPSFKLYSFRHYS